MPQIAQGQAVSGKPRDGVSAKALGIIAATFVAIAVALVHAPSRWTHPFLLALTTQGVARPAPAPAEIAARDLDVAEARGGGTLPLVGDLSILRSSEPPRREPSATATEKRPSSMAGARADAVSSAPSSIAGVAAGTRSENSIIGETQLPPLTLAPLDGAITARERDYESLGQRDRLCEADGTSQPLQLAQRLAPEADFGRALAAAALRQTGDFVVYTDKYRHMSFPMGDVPAMFGVCTDVIIRAYRAVGIDLQANIHAAHIGAGDRSIAHRRTFTLRRYFASRGASVAITDFVEDYLPGDVVTYDRPQNHGSRDHIAIVTDVIAPSGRPMIVHNRGWGPQLEDALFVDRMTGHYRYRGRTDPLPPAVRLRVKSASAETTVASGVPVAAAKSEHRSVARVTDLKSRIRRLKAHTRR